MNIGDLYRGLLRLYPADFHKQFADEMCDVFERRAGEFSDRGSPPIAFVFREFTAIAKGACVMRIAKILVAWHSNSEVATATSSPASLNAGEAAQQRSEAIRKMVTCIAEHDFEQARQYSYEEIRLKRLLQQFQTEFPVESSGTA